MDNEPGIFNSYVIKAILSNNEFSITVINQFESIKSIVFDFVNYAEVEELIKSNKIDLITGTTTTGFREYLEIMRFTDQRKNKYIVTLYDNDEPWQDPEVIKIFSADK